MEKIIDRFDKYMVSKGLNDNKVTVQLGLSVGLLGKSRKIDRDLSKGAIEKILNFYSDIEEVWLLTGEGNMLKEDKKELPLDSQAGNDNISKALEIIKSQQESIAKLSDAALIHARNIEKLLENKQLPGTNHDRKAG
ncbi:MAG: hypothetical protein CVT94_13835 [Bacteroidetes bacterium HGW-Bacteroidetes-11]|jgi:hypothetical protein|nr:MAG: hypothetical protein CVT94_13835 [Bacteroidetes bacterium HGW-Bacteroidetes-11]